MRRWIVGMGALVGTTALVLACSVGTDCDFGQCPGVAVGSEGGGGEGGIDTGTEGGVIVPPGCKPELEPKDSAPCVVDTYGIFVDASAGLDANPGTKAAPVKTFAAALAKIGNLPRIYACEGTYPERVKLTRGVDIFGGFACGAWSYSGAKARIIPTDVGFALHVAAVTAPVVFADLEVAALPGTKAAPSSIALFVARSTNVTLRRLNVQAAAGFAGADGDLATVGTTTAVSLDGDNGTAVRGGLAKVCPCSTGGSSTGGQGGDLGSIAPNGGDGTPSYVPPVGGNGAGQPRAACEMSGSAAQPGSDAPVAGSAPSPGLGQINEAGWSAGDGEKGKNGAPGQGGGGGGSRTTGSASQVGGGGGGACGGCGGGPGGGGSAGGSSVAILSFESGVKCEKCSLAASDGGNGGNGQVGADGVFGGNNGPAGGSACAGASGGRGGKGGAGAGGSGGISGGIVYKSAVPPVVDAATDAATTFKKAGDPGKGGNSPTNDGKPGEARKTYAL